MTKAYCVIWYVCADCDAQNVVQIPDLLKNNYQYSCEGCNHGWNFATINSALTEKYGKPDDHFSVTATQFTCDCGKKNMIFGRRKKFERTQIGGMIKEVAEFEPPTFGLCEECGAGHDLVLTPPGEEE